MNLINKKLNDEQMAKLWCELNAHTFSPEHVRTEWKMMAKIERAIGKEACLSAWRLMQAKRKR